MFIRLSLNLLDNILIDPTNSKKFNGNTILFKKKKKNFCLVYTNFPSSLL